MLSEGSARGGKKSGKGQLGELMEVGSLRPASTLFLVFQVRKVGRTYADTIPLWLMVHPSKDATYAAQDFTSCTTKP
jgi:hypothetical protein